MIDSILDILGSLVLEMLPVLKRKKQRREEWTGFLEEIKTVPSGPLAKYKLRAVFRTDEGKRVSIRLRKQDSTRFARGIRYRKKAGEDYPEPLL